MKQIYLINTHNPNFLQYKIFFKDKTSDITTIDERHCFTIDGGEYWGHIYSDYTFNLNTGNIEILESKKKYYQDYLHQKKNQNQDFRYRNIIFENNNHYIYLVFSVAIFSFDENQKPNDNSPVSCVIKKYYCLMIELNEYLSINNDFLYIMQNQKYSKPIDQKIKNECFNGIYYKDYISSLSIFDIKFTTNTSDYDILIPHIDIFLDFFDMKIDSVIYKIQKAINNNLIKKEKGSKKGSKKLIDLERTVEDINKIKLLYSNRMKVYFKHKLRMKDTLSSLWSIPISQTIANAIIEYHFSTMKLNYTPYEQNKSLSFYSKNN